jgi:CO/xanthine dehydrogenase FAD-binding subunit
MYYRRLPKFEYLAPKSIEEALSLIQKHKGEARIMAGGTIVISRMKDRVGVRKYLVGLKTIPNLDYITFGESTGLRIGVMANLQSIANSPVVNDRFENLALACGNLGTPQIRNMGTIGGNICSRFPTAEVVPPLMSLEAEAKITTAVGEKTVAVEDLHKELKGIEVVNEIRVPTPALGTRGAYKKYTIREGIDYATACVAVVVSSTKGTCRDIKIAFGGEAISPARAKRAEEMVRGQRVTDGVIAGAAQAVAEDAQVISDIYFSAEYKKELLKVLVRRAIKQAWQE